MENEEAVKREIQEIQPPETQSKTSFHHLKS